MLKHHWNIRYNSVSVEVEAVDENGGVTSKMQLPSFDMEFNHWDLAGIHRLFVYKKSFGNQIF